VIAVAAWRRARAELSVMTKPREIEGVLDTALIRPLGFVLVQLLRRTRATPNMVSVAAMLAGVGVGVCYLRGYGQLAAAWLALALMVLHSALDAADGQLARATGRTTPLGRVVDGVCDNVSFVAIYLAIVLGHVVHGGGHPLALVLLALGAGFSHSTHCAVVELQRMLFLNYVLGTHDTIAERPERLRQRLRAEARPGHRLLARFFLNYSLQQRTFLASSDALERIWERAVVERPWLRARFAARYRAASRRMLPAWALLGPNSHKVALLVTGFAAALVPSVPGMIPYLLYDTVVLNTAMALLILAQGRIDRRLGRELLAELGGGQAPAVP
jgi:phosphatidylglycerophosphate synthase